MGSRKRIFYLLWSLVAGFTVSCVASRPLPPPQQTAESDIEASQEIGEINDKLMKQGDIAPSSPSDYYIGPADLIDITVFGVDELTTKVRVSSRGFVTLPLLGNVKVGDLTAREAEEKIEVLLKDGGFLRHPSVTVFIAEHNSKQISVVGFVKSPGAYELIGKKTLLDALALAGGLTKGAGKTAYITRTDSDGRKEAYLVDLEALLKKGNVDLNLVLRPGDVVYISEAGNVFVEGAVIKSGPFPIKEGSTTIPQSIAAAGGLASYANPSDLKLIRNHGNGKREIIELDLEKIRNGEAEDIVVQDRDAIIVGASGVKRFFYGLGLSLGFGLVGVNYRPPSR